MSHGHSPSHTPVSFAEMCASLRFGHIDPHGLLSSLPLLAWQPQQQAYLVAWVACCEEDWDKAAEILLAVPVTGAESYLTRTEGATLRRKKSWVFWLLGNLAVSLGCAEAGEHYQRALRLLDERRMNIPWLRIQLSADHARWLASLHEGVGARKQWEAALALCVGNHATHDALPGIYAGLLGLAQAGTDEQQEALEQALAYGTLALASVTQAEARATLLCQMAAVYERLGQDEQAMTAYREALQRTNDRAQLISIWAALALLSLKDQDALVAHGYCLLALDEPLEEVPPESVRHLYLACSRVEYQRHKSKEAVSWAIKALTLTPQNAEALGLLSQILEELCERDPQVVQTAFWHDGYQLVTRQLARAFSQI